MPTPNLLAAYLPMDRRLALARGEELPEWSEGAVLVADLRGFTALGEELAHRLGAAQGAEELNRRVSACFADLIAAVQAFRGSIVRFSGDALLAVFSGPAEPLSQATAAAYGIQSAMRRHPALALRIGLGAGPLHRRLLGDPAYGRHDLLSGPALRSALAALEQAPAGGIGGERAAHPAEPCPWPAGSGETLGEDVLRAWIPPEVYARMEGETAGFVAELRQVIPFFVQVECAEEALAECVTRAQAVLASCEARLNEVEILDKGTVLVALFGAPVAHGDDALRAVGAALALRTAWQEMGQVTTARLGLSMGPLYAGLVGSPERLAYTVYGDEMNVAARLMEAAGPWEILASARVCRAAEGRFHFVPLPPIAVKGRSEPVSVARVEGQRQPALVEKGPLVGRREERARLEEWAAVAWAGQSQVVVIQGEAGIGKSRLAEALLEVWIGQGGRAAVGQAQVSGQQQPYLAWGEALRRLFDLPVGMEAVPRLQEVLAAISPELLPRLPLLGDVLGLAIPETPLTRALDARLRRASTQSLVVDLLRAQSKPLLLLLEDVHWLDAPSWSLTLAVARGMAGRPFLLALTCRPLEVRPPEMESLLALPSCRHLALGAFSPSEAAALAGARLGVEHLPEELAEFLQARGQGNPFFIEELLHALEEEGFLERRDGQVGVRRPLAQARLPEQVQGVVLARMDRLDEPSRLTLKVAAVIGRLFALSVLDGVHPILAGQEATLRRQLERLQSFDIVLSEAPDPEPAYIFKHAITHEVAYGTLLFAQRRDLHGRIARYYEARYRDNLEPHYALLAFHYERADQPPRWAYYLQRLAAQSARQYAAETAIAAYRQLLALLEDWAGEGPAEQAAHVAAMRALDPAWGGEGEMSPGERIRRERVRALLGLVGVLDMAGRRAEEKAALEQAQALAGTEDALRVLVQDAVTAYLLVTAEYEAAIRSAREARALARQVGDRQGEALSLNQQGVALRRLGRHEEALACQREALALAEGLPHACAEILRCMGTVHFQMTDYTQALRCLQEALALYRQEGSYRGEIQSLGNIVLVYWDWGQYEKAMESLQQNLARARQIGSRHDESIILGNIGDLYRYMGCYEPAVECLEACIRLTEEMDDPNLRGESLNNLGLVYLELGQYGQARTYLQQALYLRESLGETSMLVLDHSFLARAYLGLGEVEQALAHTRQALALLREMGVAVNWVQQVHFNHYRVCQAAGLPEEAQEALERAYRTMLKLAEGMGEEGRQSFLENVRVNREIAAEWARYHPNNACGSPPPSMPR